MKVNFVNKKLWSNFLQYYLPILATLLSTMLAVTIEQETKIMECVIVFILLIILFIVELVRANFKRSQKLKINGTNVNIFYGDIFKQNGIKVIPFNEFFDTIVDDKIISKKSLNGQYIEKYYSQNVQNLDNVINLNKELKNKIIDSSINRKYGGKTIQYKLGTICVNDDYFLLAFSHIDDENRAYLSLLDYILCLINMWNELDINYAGNNIIVPLLGSGITRFNDNSSITPQELLKYIVHTFEISKVNFKNGSSLTIILDKSIKDEINLYEI